MKYITFEHLSNSPQLSFLFVLKQKNQKETHKALDKLSSIVPNNSKYSKFASDDSNVTAQASVKSSATLDAN